VPGGVADRKVHQDVVKLTHRKFATLLRRAIAAGAAAIASMWMPAASTYAHSGTAGPDEVGPPVAASVAIGIICYWLVVLWPADKRKQYLSANGARGRMNR
ncbi:MAG: hypothetical protein ACREQB_08755, partial [Candidatus Binataceae bacterium]